MFQVYRLVTWFNWPFFHVLSVTDGHQVLKGTIDLESMLMVDENLEEYKLPFGNTYNFFFPPRIGMRGDLFKIAFICPH